jgi:hypothetical protein
LYHLIGADEILDNLVSLARPFLQGRAHFLSLQKAYRDFLISIQPEVPKPTTENVQLLSDPDLVIPLVKIFGEKETEERADFTTERQRVDSGLKKINTLDEELYQLFQLAVHTIFFYPTKTIKGGTNGFAIGALWINPRPKWSESDLIEILIHESTHNYIFLDELAHKHYPDYLKMIKYQSWSPTRHEMRPLNKVCHASLVNVELLLLREQLIGHPQSEGLHGNTKKLKEETSFAIDELLKSDEAKSLMTTRMHYLLSTAQTKLATIKV